MRGTSTHSIFLPGRSCAARAAGDIVEDIVSCQSNAFSSFAEREDMMFEDEPARQAAEARPVHLGHVDGLDRRIEEEPSSVVKRCSSTLPELRT